MKYIVVFGSLLALLMVAIGCAKKPPEAPPPVVSVPPAEPERAEPAPAGEEATMEGAEKFTYTCPMHPQVKQDKPGRCPECRMFLEAQVAEGQEVEYYCPMHEKVVQDRPGKCPDCGMYLPARTKKTE